jgi:hypothetical protein
MRTHQTRAIQEIALGSMAAAYVYAGLPLHPPFGGRRNRIGLSLNT